MPKFDVFNDHNSHLKHFTPEILRDLARNDAADRDYRRAAVEILVTRKHPYAKHGDLREFVEELEVELDGIVFDHPAPSGLGPLTDGVTTQTLYGTESPELELSEIPIPDSESKETKPEVVDAEPKKPTRRRSSKPQDAPPA